MSLKSEMKSFQKSGFTIIEMVIVALVLAILVVAILPKMITTTQISARVAGVMAASDIRAVQARAMYSGSSKTISFNGNSYTMDGETKKLPGGASAASHSITFNAIGEPSSGAGSFSISKGGESVILTVQSLTGKVSISQ